MSFKLPELPTATRPKYGHPRSKVQATHDHPATLIAAIPAKVSHPMRLQANNAIEWIWMTEGLESNAKVRKV